MNRSGANMKRIIKFLSVTLLVVIAALPWLLRYGFTTLHTTPYPIHTQSYQTWDEVFRNPALISVRTLNTGKITMDQAQNLDQNNPKTKSFHQTDDSLPVLANWLHHDRFGDFLIDTGFSSSFNTNPPYGNYAEPMRLLNWVSGIKNHQEPAQDISAQVRANNISLKGVFFTHFHPDHTSGTAELPDDIEYVFGKNENWFLARAFFGNHLDGKKNLKTIDFAAARAMPPLGPSVDIFGDGSLWAVSTPGHTRDHIAYVVNAKTGPVLLTGDASHFSWAFENDVAPRGLNKADTELAQKSLEQLIAFAKKYPQVKIVFGHGIKQ